MRESARQIGPGEHVRNKQGREYHQDDAGYAPACLEQQKHQQRAEYLVPEEHGIHAFDTLRHAVSLEREVHRADEREQCENDVGQRDVFAILASVPEADGQERDRGGRADVNAEKGNLIERLSADERRELDGGQTNGNEPEEEPRACVRQYHGAPFPGSPSAAGVT